MARGSRGKQLTLAQTLGAFLDKRLIPDLRARVEASPAVQRSLADALARERAAGRSADDPIAHRERTLEQIGAAWILSAVFVRFLEDRSLVEQRRLAGPGAVDSQERFGAAFPALAGNAREYLLAVFRECARLPGAREVLGAKNNLALRLGPSVAVAAELLNLLREEDSDGALRWRFDSDDTRALGDLYQDLSDAVKDRYALLQTPDFVEAFILERTLDPAVKTFKLPGLRVIDPTCGSGHFLLGACARLRALHTREDPSADPKRIAREALRHVYGVDLNPFAVAISRFRLLVDFARAAGISRLREAPDDLALDEHVVVADSLLYGGKTLELAESLTSNDARRAFGEQFVLEDLSAARSLFGQKYHAVVGNPPYIVCRDAALRETYRKKFPDSAQRQFALGAPFTERFFELAEEGGYVGLINSNSFMKREFGKGLVTKVLPRVELSEVVDTSGAYIPGHGTPTVILFGRNQKPISNALRVVMGRRGAAPNIEHPEQGEVWSSVADHDCKVGFENEFITVAELPRSTFAKHPWSLGGGGASDLKEHIEKRCVTRLGEIVDGSIGRAARTGDDESYALPAECLSRIGIPPHWSREFLIGEAIRDWCMGPLERVLFPYDAQLQVRDLSDSAVLWHLWPQRSRLAQRSTFQGNMADAGLRWYEYMQYTPSANATSLSIAFAEVATHNHFVLDRGGKVFKQTAPIIKLSADATEDDHLALLAWLNSSTACFWMKQVCHAKTNSTDDRPERGDADMIYFAFNATKIGACPVPPESWRVRLLGHTQRMESILAAESQSSPAVVAGQIRGGGEEPGSVVQRAESATALNRRLRISTQENLDWWIYAQLGLCDDVAGREIVFRNGLDTDERLFVHPQPPSGLSPEDLTIWERRRVALESSRSLQMIESPAYKRRWIGVGRGSFGLQARTYREEVEDAACALVLDAIEKLLGRDTQVRSLTDLHATVMRDAGLARLLAFLVGDRSTSAVLEEMLTAESLPFLAPMRFTDAGMEKRALWERTWALQRREDAGERVGDIPVPPKYDQKDYREARYWSLRGKLDVPRERFIAYPGATTDDAPSPLYGWAGWDHKQRADALTTLYLRRKNDDGWSAERLAPLIAGLAELIPWLKQWHNTPDDGEDQGAGDAYAHFVAAEARELGTSTEQLAAWRVPDKREAKSAARAKATKPAAPSDESADAPAKKRGRPKKASTSEG